MRKFHAEVQLLCTAVFALCEVTACGALDTVQPLAVVRVAAPDAMRADFAPSPRSRRGGRGSSREAPELVVRLSNAAPDATPIAPVDLDAGEPLDPERIRTLLARLPALEASEEDRSPFAVRPGTPPAPRAGEVVALSFPPEVPGSAPATRPEGPLRILRYGPEGEVPIARNLSITFSEPIVAVGDLENAEAHIPVRLEPQPEGRWRWLGTRTLVFEPKVRFPAATNYRVAVDAGLEAASGNQLAEPLSFAFSTPPPKLLASHPTGVAVDLVPTIFMEFDQRIDRARIAESVSLRGLENHPLVVANADDLDHDDPVRQRIDRAQPDRWIALRPRAALPPETKFEVIMAEGAPSAEGPRPTPEDQGFVFSTYDALHVERHHCRWEEQCPPNRDWVITFNNPLDPDQLHELEVEPEIEHEQVEVWGREIWISGLKRARTHYRVTVPATTRDQFGQVLGQDSVIDFRTGAAQRLLAGPQRRLVTLDPFAAPSVPAFSTNNQELSIRIYRVEPEDWRAFSDWSEHRIRQDSFASAELVFDEWVQVADKDRIVDVAVDLEPFAAASGGHFVVWVETRDHLMSRKLLLETGGSNRKDHRARAGHLAGFELLYWVQSTQLGLTSIADFESVSTWVTRLSDGRAIEGATVEVLPPIAALAKTDAHGLTTQKLERSALRDPVVIARAGSDSAILPHSGIRNWRSDEFNPELLWYHTDDRGLYRPGESIHVKGWVRRLERKKGAPLELPGSRWERVAWVMQDPRGRKLGQGTSELSALGGFDFVTEIPTDSELGQATILLSTDEGPVRSKQVERHGFMIQEFRRPEFEVKAEFGADAYILGETATVTATAGYYAGGALSNSDLTWSVSSEPGHYVPPKHDDFHFGVFRPWWIDRWATTSADELGVWTSTTNADGSHSLEIALELLHPIRPTVLRASAGVEDRNRQAWFDEDQVLVHPASLYVGLRTQEAFVEPGQRFTVEAVVVDLEGHRESDVEITLSVRESDRVISWEDEGSSSEPALVQCKAASRGEPVPCSFEFERSGVYELSASIEDPEGRRNETRLNVWVSGGKTPTVRNANPESIELIPDRKEYAVGETARVLVAPPFHPAEGIATIAANGIIRTQPFEIVGATHTLEIPIGEDDVAGINVAVEVVGETSGGAYRDTDARRRIAHASGSVALRVPPRTRSLAVEVEPARVTLAPGGETSLTLRVLDHEQRAVADAEVALAIVDESVLALSGHDFGNPLDVFYPERSPGTWIERQRAQVISVQPEFGPELRPNRMRFDEFAQPQMVALAAGSAPPADPIRIRKDLSALASWSPAISTDAQGRASVSVRLPDSVTRYRIMAVAASGSDRFGKGESQLTARLPLTARPSPPRFANFADRFELPVIVQNQTDEAMTVDVAARASHARFDSQSPTAGRRIEVPPNDRVEVRFPTSPTTAGKVRFQVAVASGTLSDAAEFDFPVLTPATSEAFATYGVIDRGAIAQPIAPPPEAWRQFGGLEITTSSTQLQALTDAMLYLNTYDFQCSEQIASRLLSVVALRDVLEAFEVEGLPKPEALMARVGEDLATLASLQNPDGGYGFWRRGERSRPWLTIHVTHAIQRAAAAGYDVPDLDHASLGQYLREIDHHILEGTSERTANTIRAYALYVRRLADPLDLTSVRRLAGRKELSVEAMGWLLPLLKEGGAATDFDALERRLANLATETAAGAQFTSSYSDGAQLILHSERRADGVVLGGLVEAAPASDLIPKLVRSLLAHRKQGRWGNTQENVFILLALSQYFERFEGVTPDFVARIWLGDGFAGQRAFEGRSTDRARLDVPMSILAKQPSPTPLVIEKNGEGRLYYRVGLRYAPRSLALEALDNGFAIAREYEAIDDPGDVVRDPDGTWRFAAGAQVRVTVAMASSMRRHHVALVDPLPAGLEVINTALATSPRPPQPEPLTRSFWPGIWRWYEHENLRDERVEAFTSLLPAGAYRYSYTARATTQGEFVVPPARAEEMYHPETFGRSDSTRVVIE